MMFERTTWHDGSSKSGHCFKYLVETKLMQQTLLEASKEASLERAYLRHVRGCLTNTL